MIQDIEVRKNIWVIHHDNGMKSYKQLKYSGDVFAVLNKNMTVSGIPLTPEILEKCGFEWDKSNSDQFKDAWCEGHNSRFDLWVKDNVFYMKSRYQEESINPRQHAMPHIKYLHQLQNLYYSLTGEELQISL